MYKLICGNCGDGENLQPISPDETKCLKCDHIHEKLSDYGTIQIDDEYLEGRK